MKANYKIKRNNQFTVNSESRIIERETPGFVEFYDEETGKLYRCKSVACKEDGTPLVTIDLFDYLMYGITGIEEIKPGDKSKKCDARFVNRAVNSKGKGDRNI